MANSETKPGEVNPTGWYRYFGNWSETAGLVAIVVIGLVLRLQHLGEVHSWFDESFDWRMAQFSLSEIITRSEQDVHPPLYFILLRGWAALFGTSLIALRYFSLLWGQLSVLGAYVLARSATASPLQPGGNSFGSLLAALFVSLSPLQVHWSQQIKMYTFGVCLAVWSTWLLLSWLNTRKYSFLLLYIPLAAALALQHHYGVFTVFAQLTYALGWAGYRWLKKGEDLLLPTVLATWATTSLWSLWLPALLNQRNMVRNQYWIREFDWQAVVNVWYQLLSYNAFSQPSLPVAWLTAEAVLIGMLLLLARREPGVRLLAWLVLVPYLVAIFWSSVLHNVFVTRFLVFAQVFLLIGGGVLIGQFRSATFRWGVALLALAGAGWAAQAHWSQRSTQADAPGMPVVVDKLMEVRTKDEMVLVCNPMLYLNLRAHGPRLARAYAFDPGYAFPHFQGTPVMTDLDYCSAETLDRTHQSWVWTLDAEGWFAGNCKVPLSSEWKLQGEQRIREWYTTLVLRLYHRDPPSVSAQK